MQEHTNTLVADFAVRGMLACLSHQETLAMFQRAFVRSGVPMAYSQGFNPHPYLSIPLPRSVGVESDVEKITVLAETPEQSDMTDQWTSVIQGQLPVNCDILGVTEYPGKKIFIPVQAGYVFPLLVTEEVLERFEDCREKLLSGQPIEIQRYSAKKRINRKFDISGSFEKIDAQQNRITVICKITPSGTVRIDEIMAWLGITTDRLTGPIRRTLVKWYNDKDNYGTEKYS